MEDEGIEHRTCDSGSSSGSEGVESGSREWDRWQRTRLGWHDGRYRSGEEYNGDRLHLQCSERATRERLGPWARAR